MKLREIVLKATRKVGKHLDSVFPPTKLVLNTSEMEEVLDDAEVAKRVIENVDRVLPYLKKRESHHQSFSEQQRREIVEKFRAAKKSGRISDKDAWAKSKYGIDARTLLRYENEFLE